MRLLLIALTLLLMGARDLPRPCLGDGMGNACAVDQCQCTALCSCRSVCGSDASDPDMGASCHMHASQEAPAHGGHFTLPEPPPPTLLGAGAALSEPRVAPIRLSHAPNAPPSLSLLPPEPPPRIAASRA